MKHSEDLYKILGVKETATQDEIKAAYRYLAKECHPDLNKGMSDEKFKLITHAYLILSNETKRLAYDNGGDYENTTTPEEDARGYCYSIFNSIIEESNSDYTDVFEQMRKRIDKDRQSANQEINRLKNKIKKLNKTRSRIKKDHKEFFKTFIDNQIKELNFNISQIEQKCKVLDIARDISKNCSFEKEEQVQPTIQGPEFVHEQLQELLRRTRII